VHQARRGRRADAPRRRVLVVPEHLAPQKLRIDPCGVDAQHIAQLTRERDQLRAELDKAQLVIEVQKKVTALLNLLAADEKRGSS
jgi:transposase